MLLKMRSSKSDSHVYADVFVGEEGQTLAHAGSLCLRTGEWQLFGAALKLGAEQTQGHLTVEIQEVRDDSN